jgi:regulator of replication initiation timing
MDEKLIQQIINQLTNDVNRLNQELVVVKSRLVLATNENTELKNQLNNPAPVEKTFAQPEVGETEQSRNYQE